MQMLLQNQSSPDVTINENFSKIDSFIFHVVADLTPSLPLSPKDGELYIFSSEFKKPNNIGLFSKNRSWNFFAPVIGCEFFVQSLGLRYIFSENGWIASGGAQNADWNSTSGVSQILNKPTLFDGSYTSLTNKPIIPTVPTLSAVATSGSYTDLANKPTLFDGSYTSLTNKPIIEASHFIGDYKHSLQSANHGKWLLCNGQAVSRTVYSSLFAIIGTACGGGDGLTTFTLPDCQGRVNAAVGQGLGLTNRTFGQVVGAETHSLTAAENGPHTHTYDTNNTRSQFSKSGGTGMDMRGTNNATTASSGNGAPHNNMQPTIFIGNTFIYAGV